MSIITLEDYEDLDNLSTEALRETGLFAIAQVILVRRLSVRSFHLVFCLTLSSNFFVSVHDYDEGANGSVP